MTGGFSANVPSRKPRTRIGQVLTELVSESHEASTNDAEPQPAAGSGEPGEGAQGGPSGPEPVAVTSPREEPTAGTRDEGRSGRDQKPARLLAGRERVASLRERLTRAARAPAAGAEPRLAAAAVVEVVEDLRARLEDANRERAEMASSLDEARAELTQARNDLEKARRQCAAVEGQAEERAQIAAEAVAEAEALAAERDQVLSELAEQRRLDDEQADLLAEAEIALARREEERETAANQIADLREELEARSVQLAATEDRLQADRSRLEARCRELEARAAELTEAKEALEAIQATVNRSRGVR